MWRRLQPVGLSGSKDKPPQAEACATRLNKKQEPRDDVSRGSCPNTERGARWMESLLRLLGNEERRAFTVHQEQWIVARLADSFLELRDVFHRLMIHFLDDVAPPQSCRRKWAGWVDVGDDHAGRCRGQSQLSRRLRVEIFHGHSIKGLFG